MISMLAMALLASAPALSTPARLAPDAFVEKVPGTLVEFKMVPVQVGGREIFFGATEVTWDLYDIYAFRLDMKQEDQAKGVQATARPSKPYGAPDRGFGHQGYPALGITHHAAEVFCAWLSAKTGKRYRLPTEAEWEAAAGPEVTEAQLDSVAWYWENADDKAHPVGKKAPNVHGLHDMFGNVQEWVKDAKGGWVTRGGSYLSKANAVGLRGRAVQVPKWNENDPQNPKSKWWLSNGPFVGFRLVHDPNDKG